MLYILYIPFKSEEIWQKRGLERSIKCQSWMQALPCQLPAYKTKDKDCPAGITYIINYFVFLNFHTTPFRISKKGFVYFFIGFWAYFCVFSILHEYFHVMGTSVNQCKMDLAGKVQVKILFILWKFYFFVKLRLR